MELSPEREDELVQQVLRDQVGIDPHQLRPILELAALGLVSSAWRNTSVENWHAAGRLHDGDMLRINSHASWRVRQLLSRWRTEMGLGPDALAESLDEIDSEDFRWLAGRIYQWVVNPHRRLPTGATLRDVAQGNLADLENDADQALSAFVYQGEDRGIGFAFCRAAAHGGLACRHWWGHPAWTRLVGRFLRALDDSGDSPWGPEGQFRARLRPEPPAVRDRAALRRTLLHQPWTLDTDSAQWIVSAGIGYLRHAAD
ncbi:MAG: hypothetical protein ACLQDY_06140 [Streptosporangiaceae bacterium]